MEFLKIHYKGVLLFIAGIICAYFLSQNTHFKAFVLQLGMYGYIGAFVAGMLFVSTFTVAPAIIILITLAAYLSPIEISIIAGCGATFSNYLIFLFIKENVTRIHKTKKKKKVHHSMFSRHSHWLIPFAGVLIMASPLPDELGIFLLSIFRMKTYQFLFISYVLKVVGIFLIVSNIRSA